MNEKRSENLEILLRNLDEIYPLTKGVFSECPLRIFSRETLEDANEEVFNQYEWEDNRYIIGSLELTGEMFFCDLDEDSSPIYLYDDLDEITACVKVDDFKDFIIEVLDILEMDLNSNDKYSKMSKSLRKHMDESILSEILDSWIDIICTT
ncbi:hypothetical protein [uncultured Clostridium sp.]|jgi:hypothetical protein|uniref:hypothetical protein n=1 Tax=uncultured Clostridium sp. TaxID=59620 RepID=UPI00262B432E|nr:hypothetical protein [uncultured Clostridium sp.]